MVISVRHEKRAIDFKIKFHLNVFLELGTKWEGKMWKVQSEYNEIYNVENYKNCTLIKIKI